MKKYDLRRFLFSIFAFAFPIFSVFAAPPVVLEDGKNLYPLGLNLEYLEDQSGELSIDEVSSDEFKDRFIQSQDEILNFGTTSSVYWIKFQLQASHPSQERWVLDTRRYDWLDAQLFIQKDPAAWYSDRVGNDILYDKAKDSFFNAVLRLPHSLKEEQVIYARFETNGEMELNLQLWPVRAPQQDIDYTLLFIGLFNGIMITMIIYSSFLYFSIRDKTYLYYALTLLGMMLSFSLSDGIGIQHMWRQADWLLAHQELVVMSLGQVAQIYFIKSLLRTRIYTPKLDKVLTFLVLTHLVTLFVSFFISQVPRTIYDIFVLNSTSMMVVSIAAGVICMKRGFSPSKYFLIATVPFFGVGIAFGLLITSGLIPSSVNTEVHFVKFLIIYESIFYSFALADRLKDERKQKVKAQQEAIENLQKADQIKDEFLANTSHELRTPLNGIIGLAEASIHDLEQGSAQRLHSNLSLVIASGRRLSLLVNDILDFSKLKNQSITLNRRPLVLHRVVESVLIMSQAAAQHKPVELVNQLDVDNLPLVYADEARLEQILFNLIGNAIKFTPQGAVTVSAKLDGETLVISVSDTGIGISKEKQSQIFNAFEQGDGAETREYEGTGLGLTVVKQLVELHQSELLVDSEEHRGSVFSFGLPTTQGEEAEKEELVAFQPARPQTVSVPQVLLKSSQEVIPDAPVSPLKGFLDILVVDDDPLNLEVICQQLNSKHYSLQVAHNGSEALKMVEQNRPDLVLLDVMMPEISGFDVCRQLRTQHHQNHLPIIFLTAKNRESDVIRGLEIGGNDYLTKPFFRSELIQRVETQLEIMLHQRQSDTLKRFANNISQYGSHEEMMKAAFEQITLWSLVDEAGVFEGQELLFYQNFIDPNSEQPLEDPSKALLKEIGLDSQKPQIHVINSVDSDHALGQYHQSGHFMFIVHPHLPDHLLVFFRNIERNPFDESKAPSYVQSMLSQIQQTQNNLESLFEDDKLVSVIGIVQPRLSEITHVKSASPTLELHFDSDKRPEYINGCSLEKLSLYFKESLLVRAHKSFLVNPSKVVSLQKVSKSRLLQMELSTGETIPVGRTHVEKISQIFSKLLP